MNVDLDKYVRNFRIFYSKIVTGHPEQANLQKKFKFLLQNEATKWRAGLFSNSLQDTANSLKSFMSKTKSNIPKSAVKKEKHDWWLQTVNFSRCFVFRSILALLELKSKEGIQMIRAHLENDGALSEGKMFNGLVFRKVSYAWTKIQKLFLNTFVSKPHSALGDCINEFPEEFIDVLYDVFIDRKVSKMTLKDINEENLEKLSDLIKTNVNFFEFENEKITSHKKGGNFKKNIFIGYLTEEKVYVVARQLPKKQVQDQSERKTLTKLSKMSIDLFKLYQSDEAKLRNLDSVVATGPKGSKAPGIQNSTYNSPLIGGSSRVMKSALETPPRMSGSLRTMTNSTLHAPPIVGSSRTMTNSAYEGLGRKNSLSSSSSYR